MSVRGSSRRASAKAKGKPTARTKDEPITPATPLPTDDVGNEKDVQAKHRIASVVVLEGFIDDVGARRVTGWVRNPDVPDERCSVEVHLDDQVLATVVADVERRDLKEAGVGDGRYAFEYKFDAPLDEATRGRVSVRAISADRSASMTLSRFESSRGATGATDLGTLKLALGKIAAHQTRSFSQQSAILEKIGLELEEIGRRVDTQVRSGAPSTKSGEFEERLDVLEAMHLRFDQALLRLMEEREAFLEAQSARARRRTLVAVLAAVVGLAIGLLVQWQFGIVAP